MLTLEMVSLLPPRGDLTQAMVDRWVVALLAQAAALHEHDAWLFPETQAELISAERLHTAWREWVDGAQLLLKRAADFQSAGRSVSGLNELTDKIGQTLAMLKFTPSVALQRHQQVERGEVVTLEEVRRGLRLRVGG